MIAIELQRGRLDYVRVLPQAGISGVHRNRRRPMCRHAAAGHVNRVGGGEHGAVRLRLQIRVRALDVALGNSVARRAIHTNRLGRRGHAVVHYPGRPAQHQHLIGSRVLAALRPSLLYAIGVGEVAGLRDRRNTARRQEDDIQHSAGRYSVGLSRNGAALISDNLAAVDRAADNLRVRFSVERGQAILLREFCSKFGGRDHGLLIRARLRDHDLRRSAGLGTLQQAAVFHDDVHHRGGHLDILRASLR